MKKSDGYWQKVAKRAFLLLSVYTISMSFWCGSAGSAYRKRELERDHQFHEATHDLQALHAKLAAQGVKAPVGDPRFLSAEKDFAALSDEISKASKTDFNGIHAMKWSAMGGVALLALYFGIAALGRRRAPRPLTAPA
jgi:hypothetical protein